MDLSLIARAHVLKSKLRELPTDDHVSSLLALGPELEAALDSSEPAQHPEEWARGAVALFDCLKRTGRLHHAAPYIRRAIDVARTAETRAWATIDLAQLSFAYNDYERSAQLLMSLDEEHSPLVRIARSYALGLTWREAGALDDAREVLREGLALARDVMSTRGECMLLNAMAGVEFRAGELGSAAAIFSRAIEINVRMMRDDALLIAQEHNLVSCLLGARDYAECLFQMDAIEARALARGDLHSVYLVRSNRPTVLLMMGRIGEVLEHYELARRTYLETDRTTGEAVIAATKAIAKALGAASDTTEIDAARGVVARESNRNLTELLELVWCAVEDPAALGSLDPALDDLVISERVRRAVVTGDRDELGDQLLNWPEQRLVEVVFGHREDRPRVEVIGDFSMIRVSGSGWIDLKRSKSARAILRALEQSAPDVVETWELYERAWPDSIITSPDDLNKLYAAIHRLKARGLGVVFSYDGSGYKWCAGAPELVSE